MQQLNTIIVTILHSYAIVSTVTIPADSSLEVIGKNTSIYLEEGDKITDQAFTLTSK